MNDVEQDSPELVEAKDADSGHGNVWRAAAAVAIVVVAAFYNSYHGQFIFDDQRAIAENTSIRHLWRLGTVLNPPSDKGQTVGGRPLLNLSLAINYALDKLRTRGYHAANILIHILAALALMGVVRRTLLLPSLRARFGRAATALGMAGALIWAVHPVQTESVTYIAQRAESMMGMFYLLTLYCAIRGMGTVPIFVSVSEKEGLSPSSMWWQIAAVAAWRRWAWPPRRSWSPCR